MAEERSQLGGRKGAAWTELFRTFQVALDPKKLALAAFGIVLTWLGWWLLSVLFIGARTEPKASDYSHEKLMAGNATLSAEDAKKQVDEEFRRDLRRFQFLFRLAGKADPAPDAPAWKQQTGIFRAAPWFEDRGPNPFLLATGQFREGSPHGKLFEKGHFWDWLFSKQMPVLIEPLIKFLQPVVLLISASADGWNRIYLILILFWTLTVWAFIGGSITRLAAVQLAGKDQTGIAETVRFVAARYGHYLSAPLVPLLFVAGLTIITVILGLFHLIPFVGDLIDSLLWPVFMILGFAQALLLVGLVGYPLMYATVSAEGSDTFDALSRSYNYVYQSPWSYMWYSVVAVAYGAIVVFFVGFMGSFVVYLSKWSISQVPFAQAINRPVDDLFIYTPTSFGWRELLVDVPALEAGANVEARTAYLARFNFWNHISAFIVSLWVTLVFLLVVGFGYSYFFTASTMIYLLMRHHIDDTDLDEVFLEDEEPVEPLMPPSAPAAPAGPQVQMVEAPTLRVKEPEKSAEPPAAPPPTGV